MYKNFAHKVLLRESILFFRPCSGVMQLYVCRSYEHAMEKREAKGMHK
jgi:hypothetical protein